MIRVRDSVLPVDPTMYEAKLEATAQKCQSVMDRVLIKCSMDARALLETHFAKCKKKEKLPKSSVKLLNTWLEDHFHNP